MRDETRKAAVTTPDIYGGIRTAIYLWCRDKAAAKAAYGPIASWDTSRVTQMWQLFWERRDFNEDISRWNVSNVVDTRYMFCRAASFDADLSQWDVGQVQRMNGMFEFATSFGHRLGGAWSTSTASKDSMFFNSPGTIAGKTKTADGTIE